MIEPSFTSYNLSLYFRFDFTFSACFFVTILGEAKFKGKLKDCVNNGPGTWFSPSWRFCLGILWESYDGFMVTMG